MALFDKLTELAKVVTDQAAVLARNAGEIGGELAKNVVDKTNDLLETGKLNSQISAANTSINELKTRLGDHYWNLFLQGEQLDDDAVVLCTTIREYTEEIESLRAQLAEMKAKREAADGQICQACGIVNTNDACFCKNCGVKLEKEEPICCCEGECKCEGEHECCCEGECKCEGEHECCCEGECKCEGEHESCCEGECKCEEEKTECCCGECQCESEAAEETVIEIAAAKVCPNCNAENDAEHTFCNKCGAKL